MNRCWVRFFIPKAGKKNVRVLNKWVVAIKSYFAYSNLPFFYVHIVTLKKYNLSHLLHKTQRKNHERKSWMKEKTHNATLLCGIDFFLFPFNGSIKILLFCIFSSICFFLLFNTQHIRKERAKKLINSNYDKILKHTYTHNNKVFSHLLFAPFYPTPVSMVFFLSGLSTNLVTHCCHASSPPTKSH